MNRFGCSAILFCTFFIFQHLSSTAQGISVSYLIPQNGFLSIPVSPFSIRSVRVPINDLCGLQTGGSFYIFPGLPMSGLPFESDEPLRDATFGVLVPLETYLVFNSASFKVVFSGGVFGLGFLNSRLDQGAWDRAFMEYQEWSLANGELDLLNQLGWGWLTGISIEIPVKRKLSISLGVNYLNGSSFSKVSGSFSGYDDTLGKISTKVDFDEATTELKGIEMSIGVSF
ncbi:MAG: hypothetical protein ACO2ZZ_01160 [Cyclobacteriaceae bacterium]